MNELITIRAALICLALLFCGSLAAFFIRRMAIWTLIAGGMVLKVVCVASLCIGGIMPEFSGDLRSLALVGMGILPLFIFSGLAILIRCEADGSALDFELEEKLKG